MSALRAWMWRVSGLFGRRRSDAELDADIRAHLDLLTSEKIAGGMSLAAARQAALREFGGVQQTKETYRDQRGLPFVETLARDVRYALRACLHNRGFSAAVVLSLSLGIGLNTALFSTLNALLLRVLPVSRPGELVLLRPQGPRAIPQFSYPQFEELRAASGSAGQLAAISRVARMYAIFDGDESRQQTALQLVSGEYFPMLGLTPSIGRLLGPEDNQVVGGQPVAVISDAMWRRRFAASPDVVGSGMTVNGTRLTIVGVAPRDFSGVWLEAPVDLWVPLVMQADVHYAQNYYNNNGDNLLPFAPQREIRWLEVIGRVAKGTRDVRPALDAAFQQSMRHDAESEDDRTRLLLQKQTLTFVPFASGFSNLRGRFAQPLYALLGMAALILIVACANTANLLLARAEARRREIAIRLAIGASRGRVVRQLLTENAVLVLAAVVVGLLSAGWAGDVLIRMALATTGPLPFSAVVDARVFGFTMLVAVGTVVLFGLAPAYRATRVDLTSALKAATASGRARLVGRKALVVAQMALSLVLVVGAGLLVGTLRNYVRVDLGFAPEHVMSVWISPRASGFGRDRLPGLYRNLVEGIERVPGVRSASVAVCGLAVSCQNVSSMNIDGYELEPGERTHVQENEVGLGYFRTVGMRLLEGRDFDAHDTASSPKVAIVNQAMVRRYFGGKNALGRTFGDGRGKFEVVGVIEDARVNRVQDAAEPMAFYPIDQLMTYVGSVEVRAAGDPQSLASAVRRAVGEVDKTLPVDRTTMLSRAVELNLSQETMVARVAVVFGLFALVLACFGLCGMMSYVVSRRTPEFGLRMALGASGASVRQAVMRESLWLSCLGLLAGIPIALTASRALSSLLFGVAPTDVATIAGASTVLLASAALAGALPAWRASRVDPIVALRCE